MSDLIVVVFEGRHTADEVLPRIMKMEQDWEVDLWDVGVLSRDKSGKISLRHGGTAASEGFFSGGAIGGATGLLIGVLAANPAAGLLAGTMAGSSIGSLAGAFDDADAEDAFAAKVGGELKPDMSALAIVGWSSRPTKLLNELEGFKGKVIETSLSVSDEKALREMLEKT